MIDQVLNSLPHVKAAVLFGSRARGDWTEYSDYDLFVVVELLDVALVKPSCALAWSVRPTKDQGTHVSMVHTDGRTVFEFIFFSREEFESLAPGSKTLTTIKELCHPDFVVMRGVGKLTAPFLGGKGQWQAVTPDEKLRELHEEFQCQYAIARNFLCNGEVMASDRVVQSRLREINRIYLYELYRRSGKPCRQHLRKLETWISGSDWKYVQAFLLPDLYAHHHELLDKITKCRPPK